MNRSVAHALAQGRTAKDRKEGRPKSSPGAARWSRAILLATLAEEAKGRAASTALKKGEAPVEPVGSVSKPLTNCLPARL